MEHTPPVIGRMAERHSRQTGRREIFTRGAPQRRQSEGNRVANKLSARPPAQETNEECFAKSLVSLVTMPVPVARIGDILLLKTSLPRPGRANGGPTGRICFSITARHAARNAGEVSRQRRDGSHAPRRVPAPAQTRDDSSDGNNRRSAPAAATATAGSIFR